jgi:hypothetical protein
MSESEKINERKVIAWQLSLLGDAPKAGYQWRRPYYTIRFFGGETFPLSDDEIRQNILLRPDSKSFLASRYLPGRKAEEILKGD